MYVANFSIIKIGSGDYIIFYAVLDGSVVYYNDVTYKSMQ